MSQESCQGSIVYPVQRPDLFPLGATRILLFGHLAAVKALAAAGCYWNRRNFYSIDAASIMSKWLGEAEQNVAKLFGSARKSATEGKPRLYSLTNLTLLW